jgi:Asp-tRNA(Asn)/Glu-tRNA(Gln) amidotransferase A subunit family amidase
MVRTELFRRLQKEFERYDFLLSPTLAAPALPVDQDAFAPVIVDGERVGGLRGAWYPYTWPFNLTGHPALTMPSGWSAAKLPTAVQIVGPFYAEARLFDLAARLEAVRPWAHQRPPEPS